MTGRLKTALKKHGWTEERIGKDDWAHRLSVSPAHEGENPIVLAPTDDDWLKRHKLLPGRAKARPQLQAKPLHRRGTAQPAGGAKKTHRWRPGTVAL